MEKNQSQNHTKETLFYAISRMLERASYYGFRALVVLYMIGETLHMERAEAIYIYGWFTGSLAISAIIGALLGDLLLGNRKTILIGGIIQALGIFCICFPSATALYLGLALIVIGSGFFTPNIIASFGKSYLNKIKLLDSGFMIFFLAINFGAFFGILFIGYLGESFGYRVGFFVAGILMLQSLIPILFIKEKPIIKIEKTAHSKRSNVVKILIGLLVIGLFWGAFDIANIRIYQLQFDFRELPGSRFSNYFWQADNAVFIIPLSIIAIILWTRFYNSQFFKLLIGFVFGILSLGILLLIPEFPTEKHILTFLISMVFLGISEIHIAPILYSILTRYANPKYLTILISLAFFPSRFFCYDFWIVLSEIP